MTDLDKTRSYVYDVTLATGRPPLRGDIARAVESSESSVREALAELSARRVLVLQPDGEILMAPPFSAVPTPYVVTTESFSGFANCGWDALGVVPHVGDGQGGAAESGYGVEAVAGVVRRTPQRPRLASLHARRDPRHFPAPRIGRGVLGFVTRQD